MKNRADLLAISDFINGSAASLKLLSHGRNRTETNCNHHRIRIKCLFLAIAFQNDPAILHSRKKVVLQYGHVKMFKQIRNHLAIWDRGWDTCRQNLRQGFHDCNLFAILCIF